MILVGGTAIAQVIAIAASPILTRIYQPSDFGALQVFISIVGLALVASTGRYEVAVLLPTDDEDSLHILAVAVLCGCFTTLVAIGFVVICHYHNVLPSSISTLKSHLWLLPISLMGGALYQALSYWAMRRSRYKQIATTKLVQVGAQVGTQLSLGFVIHGSLGLLIGDTMGRIMGSGRFLRDLWREYAIQIRAIRVSRMVQMAVRYRDYPLISIWGALINVSGLALPSLFLAQYYGAQNTGWFALDNRVLGVPSVLIGVSIAQVYAAEAATLSRSDPGRLMYLFIKTTRRMLYLGVGPCVIFSIFAPWIFQFIFGHAWREASEYARCMAFMVYAALIFSPVQTTLIVLERQRIQFVWDVVRLALTVLMIALPHHFGFGPRIAIFSYAVAMTFMYGVHLTLSYFAIKYRADTATAQLSKE